LIISNSLCLSILQFLILILFLCLYIDFCSRKRLLEISVCIRDKSRRYARLRENEYDIKKIVFNLVLYAQNPMHVARCGSHTCGVCSLRFPVLSLGERIYVLCLHISPSFWLASYDHVSKKKGFRCAVDVILLTFAIVCLNYMSYCRVYVSYRPIVTYLRKIGDWRKTDSKAAAADAKAKIAAKAAAAPAASAAAAAAASSTSWCCNCNSSTTATSAQSPTPLIAPSVISSEAKVNSQGTSLVKRLGASTDPTMSRTDTMSQPANESSNFENAAEKNLFFEYGETFMPLCLNLLHSARLNLC
jgi:hypothetical protein